MKFRNALKIGISCLVLTSLPAVAQTSNTEDEEDSDFIGCGMLGNGIGAAMIYAGTQTGVNLWTAGMSAALAWGVSTETTEYCNHVTEATIEAYENAMNNLGIQIMWHQYHDPYMPWCLSIRAHDCIPYVEPGDVPDPSQQLFVQQSWEIARLTAERLLNGATDNSARITPLALGSALRSAYDRSGLQSSPSPFQNSFDSVE
ncbi:MAG: hypothetical protein QNJ11_06725 [Woeseiaceae bacterium]|nr:hypothetical protein [Woeseiaceae bacterium]